MATTVITYDVTEDDDRDWRMTVLRDGDYDRYFELLGQRREARCRIASEIIGLAKEHGCVMVKATSGPFKDVRRYVSPSLAIDGGMRHTLWDNYGPISHIEIGCEDDLADELPSGIVTVSYKR